MRSVERSKLPSSSSVMRVSMPGQLLHGNTPGRKGEIGRSARMLLRVLRGDVPRQQEAEPPR
jgi:hypothetical protein